MAVFHIYIDESGKLSGKTDFTSLCGYVGHAAEWERFNKEWDTCRFKWQVPPLHMARVTSPERKEDQWTAKMREWGDYWEPKRDAMLSDFAAVIATPNIACIGAVVDANAYRTVQQEFNGILEHKDSNVFSFHDVIMGSLRKIETVDGYSPVSIVIDDDPENALGYYSLLNVLRAHENSEFSRVKQRIHGICFCNDASYPGIQAADMVSFTARHMKILEKDDKPLPVERYGQLTHKGIHQPRFYTERVLRQIAEGTRQAVQGGETINEQR